MLFIYLRLNVKYSLMPMRNSGKLLSSAFKGTLNEVIKMQHFSYSDREKTLAPDNKGDRSIQESFSISILMATEFLVPVFVKPKLENVIRKEEKCRNPGSAQK